MSLRSKRIQFNVSDAQGLEISQETSMPHSNISLLRSVFIIGDKSLFEEGLEKLLSLETCFSIVNAKYTDDPEFLAAVAQSQPDVILLNESTAFDSAHILDLLFSKSSLTAQYVVVIRLGNNVVDVYEMPKRFVITKRHELIDVVLGKFQQVPVN